VARYHADFEDSDAVSSVSECRTKLLASFNGNFPASASPLYATSSMIVSIGIAISFSSTGMSITFPSAVLALAEVTSPEKVSVYGSVSLSLRNDHISVLPARRLISFSQAERPAKVLSVISS